MRWSTLFNSDSHGVRISIKRLNEYTLVEVAMYSSSPYFTTAVQVLREERIKLATNWTAGWVDFHCHSRVSRILVDHVRGGSCLFVDREKTQANLTFLEIQHHDGWLSSSSSTRSTLSASISLPLMPYSHHSHSGEFCKHATGRLEEVVLEAIRQGFKVYGLTEHAPRYRVEDLYPEEVCFQIERLGHTADDI